MTSIIIQGVGVAREAILGASNLKSNIFLSISDKNTSMSNWQRDKAVGPFWGFNAQIHPCSGQAGPQVN
jgi:hypothetical protein